MSQQPKRDQQAVGQFIERFAAVLADAGMALAYFEFVQEVSGPSTLGSTAAPGDADGRPAGRAGEIDWMTADLRGRRGDGSDGDPQYLIRVMPAEGNHLAGL